MLPISKGNGPSPPLYPVWQMTANSELAYKHERCISNSTPDSLRVPKVSQRDRKADGGEEERDEEPILDLAEELFEDGADIPPNDDAEQGQGHGKEASPIWGDSKSKKSSDWSSYCPTKVIMLLTAEVWYDGGHDEAYNVVQNRSWTQKAKRDASGGCTELRRPLCNPRLFNGGVPLERSQHIRQLWRSSCTTSD
ncbi:4885_t:CDS:2 [Acaulospora colombiana]|uniref:4885_t:CDS:1 n=1 Tax=Acaulospora colombiana TaxID=27376 RepID=A0ACA9LLW2_9GLOM|nr:4885_t:CDS:2 [Acaulospora colombiana]